MLKVNRNFVYKLIKNGEIESVNIGSIKITKNAIDDYVKRQIRRW